MLADHFERYKEIIEKKGSDKHPIALDLKIAVELAPKHDEKDGEEVKQSSDPQRVEVADTSASTGTKEALVAEPLSQYEHIIKEPVNSPILGRSAVITRRY